MYSPPAFVELAASELPPLAGMENCPVWRDFQRPESLQEEQRLAEQFASRLTAEDVAACSYHSADIEKVCELVWETVRTAGLDLDGAVDVGMIALGLDAPAVRDATVAMLMHPTVVSKEGFYVSQPQWACAMKLAGVARCPVLWAEDLGRS